MTTIKCLLEESACISQHEPGIIQGEKIVLFSEWNNFASSVAERLTVAGVKRGDRVTVFMANDWRLMIVIIGIIRAGAIACPISTRLPRAGVADRMSRIESNHLVAYLAGGNTDGLGEINVLSPEDLIDTAANAAPQVDHIALDDPAMIIFTSGSSGAPKPVVLSYGNLYYNARGANQNLRLRSKDRWLLNLPMYHVGGIGILFRCLLSGAAAIIPEMKERLIDSILHYKPSFVSVVPTQLGELADDEDADMIKGIKAFLVGGDAMSDCLRKRCLELKWPVFPTYGMTEMASQITTAPELEAPEKRVLSAGKVLRHRELMISEDGEILVRGPCLFTGYWKNGSPEVPRLISGDTGDWFPTGDLGFIDDEGFLTVTGRKDNQFVSGGENIQPEEIEKHLLKMKGVQRAVVVPIPDSKFGMRPVAFIDADTLRVSEWCAELAAELPSFMIPEAFHRWPENEGNDVNVSRARLTEMARSGALS